MARVVDPIAATAVVTGRLATATETVIAAIIQSPGTWNIGGERKIYDFYTCFLDGRKTLEFYVPPVVGAGYSLAFGNVWLQWITRGMYVGLRRIIWSIQVSPLFRFFFLNFDLFFNFPTGGRLASCYYNV